MKTTAFKSYLHLGSSQILGPSWHNVDGDITILFDSVQKRYGWVDENRKWQIWFGKSVVLRRLITYAVLKFLLLTRPDTLPIQLVDLRKSLPFPDHSFQGVYSSHVLEHLYRDEALALLKEIKRVLVPNGLIRIVVPDMRSFVEAYVNALEKQETSDRLPADELNYLLHLRPSRAPQLDFWQKLRYQSRDMGIHKWMYDIDSLHALVRDAGYVEIRKVSHLESEIPVINEIETPDRLLNGAGICIEARSTNP